jgi:hypothetical protein
VEFRWLLGTRWDLAKDKVREAYKDSIMEGSVLYGAGLILWITGTLKASKTSPY